jgi:hypothetical protein
MPLPIFPTESGVPGDGSLVAIHGGGSTEVLGGLILFAQALEMRPTIGVLAPAGPIHKGSPLLLDGVTIWIEGALLLDTRGEPTVTDYADMLSRWTTVRDNLLLTDYELFTYYHPSSPTTYRKYKTVNTYFLRSWWNNPVCMHFLLGGVTTDKTLYTTAPGA